jgi:hypothetical protein
MAVDRLWEAVRSFLARWFPGDNPVHLIIRLRDGRSIKLPAPQASAVPRVMLTECETDILAVIKAAGRRLTAEEIKEHLERALHIHGDSTIEHALARLVKTGLVDNKRDARGRGYGIIEE